MQKYARNMKKNMQKYVSDVHLYAFMCKKYVRNMQKNIIKNM